MERILQAQALKIIYGYDENYRTLWEDGVVETLKNRREAAILKFALN